MSKCLSLLAVVGLVAAHSSVRLSRTHHKLDRKAAVDATASPRLRGPGSTIPMGGGLFTSGYYSANLAIGEPAKDFSVLVDTGSSNVAVPYESCTTCGSPPSVYSVSASSTGQMVGCNSDACSKCNLDNSTQCLFGNPYCALSDSSFCGGGISYGGGSSFLSGRYCTDKLSFGGLTATGSVLGIDREVPAQSFPTGGILGLAHDANACNPTCVPSIFRSLIDDGQSDPIFGMCLSTANGGVLDLGFVNDTMFTGELQWVPLTQERWWNVGVMDVQLSGNSLNLPPVVYSYANDQIGSFFDSGTGVLLFSPEGMTAFQTTYQANFAALPKVTGSDNIFNGACLDSDDAKQLSKYPTVTIVIQGEGTSRVSVQVPPENYFIPSSDNSLCLGVQGVPGIGIVMGDVVMDSLYLVHDLQNSRVGIATVKSCV